MIEKEINKLMKNRRSIFPAQYNDTAITNEFINTLLENANWAPTHKMTEPWRFKVIQGEAKERLGAFLADTYADITDDENFSPFKHKKIKNNCRAAHTIIAICMQRDLKERVPEWEEIASTAMAVQNMWLTCTANDIGCYWSSPKLITYMHEFFELGEGEKCLGFFYLGGYDKEDVELVSKRNTIADKVEWMS